jgi:hypothetical protein
MAQATFDELLEAIEGLPIDEQAELLEVARRRLAEKGRARIVQDVLEGRQQFSEGKAKPASVGDIMREIQS